MSGSGMSGSGMSASRVTPRLMGMRSADMRRAKIPPATAATHATNRPLTTPPDAKGQTHGSAGGGVSFCVPLGVVATSDSSRSGWFTSAKSSVAFALLATSGCCGHPVRDPGPIRKILTHFGELLEPPPLSRARGPPTAWGELAQVHFRAGNLSSVGQASDRRAARYRHPHPLNPAGREASRPRTGDPGDGARSSRAGRRAADQLENGCGSRWPDDPSLRVETELRLGSWTRCWKSQNAWMTS